jgi:predicted RNA-binding protein with PIN domain
MVIVDGNNVMGQRVGWHRDKPAAQQRLIEEVEYLARSEGASYILVFDAKPRPDLPDQWSRPGLSIRYAKPGAGADELILELVYRHQDFPDLLVVTSDRELAREVQVLGAGVMRSGSFRRMLEKLP